MIKPLSIKKEFFADNEAEALNFVDDKRDGVDGEFIIAQQVNHKSNKNGDYWRVLLTYRYNTAAGIQESGGDGDEEAVNDDNYRDINDTANAQDTQTTEDED